MMITPEPLVEDRDEQRRRRDESLERIRRKAESTRLVDVTLTLSDDAWVEVSTVAVPDGFEELEQDRRALRIGNHVTLFCTDAGLANLHAAIGAHLRAVGRPQ